MSRRHILTERQRHAVLALPTGEPSLLKHYTLAEDDLEHIGHRRRRHNRRGYPLSPAGVLGRRAMGPSQIVGRGLCAAGAAAAADEVPIEERLAAVSAERGEKVFLVCRARHMIEAGALHTIGPNLWGVVGRPVASAEGYDRYTPAMSALGGAWTPERLDIYLRQPMVQVQGTTMVFPGVPDARARADLIAWLNRNSPAPLEPGSAASPPAPARGLGLLVAGEGAPETHAYGSARHSERIVTQQGLTRSDWDEILGQTVEGHEMNPIEEPHRSRVLGYLATHYGPDRPNFLNRWAETGAHAAGARRAEAQGGVGLATGRRHAGA